MTPRRPGRSPLRAVATLGLAAALAGATLSGGAARADARPLPLRLSPELVARLDAAAPTDQVAVVAVLRAQADLRGLSAMRRGDRLATLEGRLRSSATWSQRPLLGALGGPLRRGLVTRLVPLWIADEVALTATPAVIRAVAARPEVLEVVPEQTLSARPAASTSHAPAVPAAAVPAAVAATDPAPEPNVAQVGAPAMWAQGLRGQGVVVASLDTGVDVTHPDLAARWRGGKNSWYDPNGQHPTTPTDISGHGTQTMGVIVGGSAGGTSIGVAPGATWIAAKIFNDRGTTTTTAVHQAFQWVLDPDHDPATADAPNVVSNSWTLSSAACALDFQPDLRALRAAGIVPVFAAGNDGPLSGSVLSPANLPEALAVGSVDASDVVDASSSRGPSACTGSVAPAITAPGVNIRTTDLYGGYIWVGGTSLAAPAAAGVLALLLSGAPGTSPDRQVAALESSAVDLGAAGTDGDYGFGRIDAAAAYRALTSTPDFSVTASPTTASTTPGGAVSYTVTSAPMAGFSSGVALTLSGLTAAQGSATVSPATIAGGSGTATVTVTTSATLAPGSYPLTVTATSGSLSHTVALTLTVTAPPDFGVGVSPAKLTVAGGGSGTASVSLTRSGGFAAPVALTVSGLPAAVGSASVAPATISGTGTAAVTVAVATGAAPGSYALTVTGTSGTLTHTAGLTLVVPAPDFGLAATPASASVVRGRTATYKVTVTGVNGFTGSVGLALAGLPRGATATWTGAPVPGSGSATLTVRTSTTTARGSSTLTVTGTSGSLRHQLTVTLVVT